MIQKQKQIRILSALLGAGLSLSTLLSGWSSYAEETESSIFTDTELQLIEAIDTDYILEKIEYVHNNIGPRLVGTPADESSAAYFAKAFAELGYEPFSLVTARDGEDDYFETFTDSKISSHIGASITINGREYAAAAPTWSDSSVYKGYNTPTLTGETIYFEDVEEAIAANESEISGKIVLTNRKDLTVWDRRSTAYADAVRELEKKGAAAVVFFYSHYTVSADGGTSREYEFQAPTTGEEINIPVILTSYLDGQTILQSLTCHDQVESTTATVVNRRNTQSSNILAIKYAETPSDKYVMIGAHRDSVFGAEGVNDNLSGSVNVLAIAKALQDIPTDTNVIFALWGGEESGLLGSKFFYSDFLEPDNWGVEHIIAYYNMDMAATSQTRNSVLTIHTPYRDSDGNPLQSTAGDVTEAQAIRYWNYTDGKFSDWWTVGHDNVVVDLQYFGSCSDHASITGATGANGTTKLSFGEGIPTVYLFWGDRLGDGINEVTEQNYHVMGDVYKWPETEDSFTVLSDSSSYTGNYSIERAQILATVLALSVYNSAVSPLPGVETDTTYIGDFSATVSYNYKDQVVVDGTSVSLGEDRKITISADNKEHTIQLTDGFGNTASYKIQVLKSYKISFWVDGELLTEKTVGYGLNLTDIPTIPTKTGYTETAPVWSVTNFNNITEDITVQAIYTADSDPAEEEGAPQTGDNNPLILWVGFSLLAGAGILLSLKKKRTGNQNIR
jgi:aminopeptidase YwaD